MYDGIKTATGPTATKTAPLKSKTGEIITDQCKQLDRWVEHYLELNATQNVVMDAALDALHKPTSKVKTIVEPPPKKM